jgi:hypothetical protein
MPEVDDDGIARHLAECGGYRAQTFTDLKSIAAAQTGNDTKTGSIGYGNRLCSKRRGGSGPATEAIGQAAIIEAKIEKISDGAPLHVAVDEHD